MIQLTSRVHSYNTELIVRLLIEVHRCERGVLYVVVIAFYPDGAADVATLDDVASYASTWNEDVDFSRRKELTIMQVYLYVYYGPPIIV